MARSGTAPVVLASGSARRAALLHQIRIPFEVRVPRVDESRHTGEAPDAYVTRLAADKVRAVRRMPEIAAERVILGADTAVVVDDEVFGKPADRAAAAQMLGRLSGRVHRVLTAVAVDGPSGCAREFSDTRVWFRVLSDADVAGYLDSGEGAGKAGGYAIQGAGAVFVERIEGSYSGVVGLPLAETQALLAAAGVDTWGGRARTDP